MPKRTARVCPYLGAADNPSIRFSAPDLANTCYAVPSGGPAHLPLDFQARTCLADQFGRCSRYKAAEEVQTRRLARGLFLAGGGLVTLLFFAGCAFLAILALILATLRPGLVSRVTDTPQPAATPQPTATLQPTAMASPTLTPTASLAPTEPPTAAPTATPQPALPTATVSSVSTTGDQFVSPLATPTLPPTATRPRPTATRRPAPTATQRPVSTSTPAPTRTPSATSTRAPTATPKVTCRAGDTMTFNPAVPTPGQLFIIEVRSLAPYADISLTGPGSPRFNGVEKDGSYYVWRWEEAFETGTYTFSFKIGSGAATCVTASVTVAAATTTPTPAPTVAPQYDLLLELVGGDDFRPIFTDTQPVVFELDLTNTGNITDTFEVGLAAGPPDGWTVQYCVGGSCSDQSGMQVTLTEDGVQRLSIQLIAAPGAQAGDTLQVTLSVWSLGDMTKQQSLTVTVVVTNQ
jgi:hypothetical protein